MLVYSMLLLERTGIKDIEVIFSFSEIHTRTIQNTKKCNYRLPATLTGKDELSLAFLTRI